jgi:prepilin-type processing-associated H-X9-DG protein
MFAGAQMLLPDTAANKQYNKAVTAFAAAKESDLASQSYEHPYVLLQTLIKDESNDLIRLRAQYYLILTELLRGNYTAAAKSADVLSTDVRKLSKTLGLNYPVDIVEAVSDGSASLDQGLVALGISVSIDAAGAGESLVRYIKDSKQELRHLESTVMVLSALDKIFGEPGMVKAKTEQALCQHKMRKIVSGYLKYAHDNGGKLAPVHIVIGNSGSSYLDWALWPSIIGKYLPDKELQAMKPEATANTTKITYGSLMQCPAAPPWENGFTSTRKVDYGVNFQVETLKVLANIGNPHEFIIVTDSDNAFSGPSWGHRYIQFRHSDGANVGYADGHVAWVPRSELLDNDQLPMWKAKTPPTNRVNLMLDNLAENTAIPTQKIISPIDVPTYISKGDGLSATVMTIDVLGKKALVIEDNSEKLGQNIAFSIEPVSNGYYRIKFQVAILSGSKGFPLIFDVRNSDSKKLFTLGFVNRTDVQMIMDDGKKIELKEVLSKEHATAIVQMDIDLVKWQYELQINNELRANGLLNAVEPHNIRDMVFWTSGISKTAIADFSAEPIK